MKRKSIIPQSLSQGIQTFGRLLLLPIAVMAPIGMVMGICGALSQSYMIEKLPFLSNEVLQLIISSLQQITNVVFTNIPLLFAMGSPSASHGTKKGSRFLPPSYPI